MKNITARFAWHDSSWNGQICRDPSANQYCRDNYSLLSGRIEKRIDIGKETEISEKPFYEASNQGYFPPCYWTINAFGSYDHQIEDPHPFKGLSGNIGRYIEPTPPYKADLLPNSIFTWCFKLGFGSGSGSENYDPKLEESTKNYLSEIENNRSLTFAYANYSNPVNGDDRKYLLLGVSTVTETEMPGNYQIPTDNLRYIRTLKRFKYFPTLAWQFRVGLDPDSSVLLPYQSFVQWYESGSDLDKDEREKVLEEVSVPVTKKSVIPHFKYVSMHIGSDKSIYLLYELKKSIGKMMKHDGIVDYEALERADSTLNDLISREWIKRGRFPGFKNLLELFLKKRINNAKKAIELLENHITTEYGSVDRFMEQRPEITPGEPLIQQAIKTVRKNWEDLTFLSQFDFTKRQFENILDMIDKAGIEEYRRNPYLIYENYNFDQVDNKEGDIDDSDYGINVFQIDIALMPDLNYANWNSDFDVDSPERLRALIAEILKEKAESGDTYTTRSEIIEELKNYPLFYTFEELDINNRLLHKYEMEPLFREKFHIENKEFSQGEVIYQLLEFTYLERLIRHFLKDMAGKTYKMDTEKQKMFEGMLTRDRDLFQDRIVEDERRSLYGKILSNRLVVLSGKAGSGKTSAIVHTVKEFLSTSKTPVFVLTPTGRSNMVIRDRLTGELNKIDENKLMVSTIHRFLYSSLMDRVVATKDHRNSYVGNYKELRRTAWLVRDLMSSFLDGEMSKLNQLVSVTQNLKFTPKVVIIDESSMINEQLLGALFMLLGSDSIEHLILVGDEKQLPPIGAGRPFADLIAYLKKEGMEDNYIRLEANYRFREEKLIGQLASLLEDDKDDPDLLREILEEGDDSLALDYFEDKKELKDEITNIAQSISGSGNSNLSELFAGLIESGNDELAFDKLQILTPKRYGKFASTFVNNSLIKNGVAKYEPRTKLICEENQYVDVNSQNGSSRHLALANGSLGYIRGNGKVYFKELEEIENQYPDDYWVASQLNAIRRNARDNGPALERYITLGYSITVHKSQGSDYDNVILILSESSRFLTRELFYTAVTRIKGKLHVLVPSSLKNTMYQFIRKIMENSEINKRKTLLFAQNEDIRKVYPVSLKNGKIIQVRSKIEKIIATKLDTLGVDFEYEPQEFLLQYSIIPDFKLNLDSGTFYIEHLGRMDNKAYRRRWHKKLEIYNDIGVIGKLITTSEGKETKNQDEVIERIVREAQDDKLSESSGGYSNHHYLL